MKIFKNKSDWYPWQREVYDMLFDRNGNVKPAKERRITYIFDVHGNNGKSLFLKHLLFTHSDVTLLAEASSSQLKSAIVQVAHDTKVFLIDMPRTADASYNGIFNALEHLKNGVVSSQMYGAQKLAMFNCPHVILTGNIIADFGALSPDRWQILEIDNESKTLKDTTKKHRKIAEFLIESQKVKQKLDYLKKRKEYKKNLKLLSAYQREIIEAQSQKVGS